MKKSGQQQRRGRLSDGQRQRLVEAFMNGASVRAAARLAGVQANTVTRFFLEQRKRRFGKSPCVCLAKPVSNSDKKTLLGLRLRGDRVRVIVSVAVADAAGIERQRRKTARPESRVICADGWRLNFGNPLKMTVPASRLLTLTHTVSDAARIEKIEHFWQRLRVWLSCFRGIPPKHFYLYLKEAEWRLNGSGQVRG